MAAPSFAYTIARAAEIREDEELLREMAMELEPEDGCLWIHGTDDQETLAFTERGMESLRELLPDFKRLKMTTSRSCRAA
jgi:hypothetical protein